MLLVLRAANCLQPCIQWYAGILRSLHTDSAPGLCVPERDITLLGEPISPKSFVQNLNMDCCHFSQGYWTDLIVGMCMPRQLIRLISYCAQGVFVHIPSSLLPFSLTLLPYPISLPYSLSNHLCLSQKCSCANWSCTNHSQYAILVHKWLMSV